MTKKQLWESKLSQRCKSLKEAYHDMSSATMSDGTQVMAAGSTRSTRTYNYEDVRFKFSGGRGEGTYSWMNRPWQRFDFASALQKAMIDAGVDKEFARECIEKSGSLRSAIEFFAKNYKVDKKEVDKEESLKESDMMNESEYQKTYDKIAQLEKRQKELKAKQKKLIANKASQEEIDKVSEQLGDIHQEIGECRGYIKELQSIDGMDESKKLGESYSEKELLDAVMDSFGFTEDEALEYIKKASDKTKQELVKGFRQDAKKNFYDESVIEEKLIKYAIDMVHWEPATYLPEWAQIVDDNEYPIIVEAPENASIEDIKDELIKLGAHENVNADIEGDFEFDYEDIDYRVADESESLKEEIEEDDDKVYQIKYWLTEEDREEGFSDIFIDSFDSKQEAIMKAKKMVDRGDVASVEVFDADDATEQPVYFYDGNEEEKLEESKQLNEMVIDLILDRKEGAAYSPKDFYGDCMQYSSTFNGIADAITRAMDEGTEEDVKKAICDYIRANGYNEKICDFVNSVQWLEESLKEARGAGKGQKLDKFFRLVGNLHKDNLSKEEIARLEKAKAEVERFEPTSEYEKKDKKNLLQQIERVLKDGKLEEAIDLNKHVWEGWTVQDFIDELEPLFDQIMSGRSWQKPFKDKAELKAWCIDNQPYYKRYIPGVVEYFFKKMKKNENLNEKLVAYDSKRWEPEDIELHKSINWKERNYEDFAVSEDSFETEVVAYELKGGPQRKTVKVVKHLRANPIYPPYYRATQQPFKNVVGPMYDGHKHGKYDIHDRYETQEVYDILSN